MKTFLFAWNPNNWDWKDLGNVLRILEQNGVYREPTSVQSHRKISVGDRAFLMRLGKEPKGIMASGFVALPPYQAEHWDGSGKMVYNVMIDFELILDPKKQELLGKDILNSGLLAEFDWSPRGSGVEIRPEVADALEKKWFEFISNNKHLVNTLSETSLYTEGSSKKVTVNHFERNPYAREKCIEYYGLSCSVCGFNFQDVYGEIGKGFIHVHHLEQVSDMGSGEATDPIKDLRPVCPNCHAMLHSKKNPYSIEELKKQLIQK
ncbi:MAG: HNH endonuclease [Candidatus Zophobacter franzmannii]|nr:HNH endonuclease [Candidatus Zophobacter franzmannii]